MMSLTKRVILQMLGDRRSVALILFAPLLVMTLIYLLLGNSNYVPTIAIDREVLPAALVTALEDQEADIVDVTLSDLDTVQYLKDNKDVDAVFSFSASGIQITMLESSTKSGKALSAIQEATAALNPAAVMDISFVYGHADESTFESMGHIFLGIFSFFFVFIISGMALVRERSSGTLERLLMSPIQRREVILGYTAGYGVFAVLQAVAIVLYSIYVLGLHCEGNLGWVILTMVLMAMAAVSFGAMISVFTNTEFQVVQLIPIVLIPQVFFSGLIPLDTIPYHLGNLSYLTPVYYGCTAIKKVMVEGGGAPEVWRFLLALIIYTFILSVLNTRALRKYRKL